jgi:hypothetical protein
MGTDDRRGCLERIVPWELEDTAQAVALAENPANSGADEGAPAGERLALVKRKMWRNGRTLAVKFLDGSPKLREKVQQYAARWTEHANLAFDFSGTSRRPEIRISFSFDPGSSWSALGTDALVERYFPRHQPTMNFGWFDDQTPDEELSRVIVHEFGHAIGCIHEHQNPKGGIPWNQAAVLAYYAGPPNYWDEETIRFNILDKYKQRQLNGTDFDPRSIMLYAFPGTLTENGVGTQENTTLSDGDIAFIRTVYPR